MSKIRILVVDDDPDLCELITEALTDEYLIEGCNSITEAENLIRHWKPAIAVLDINLPSGSGLDLCKNLSSGTNNLPLVLLISGDSSLELQLEAYNHGGSDFLAKPFKIRELRAKIDRLSEFYNRQSQLKRSENVATKAAMNAMVEASHYGEVLRFYNAMYKANSVSMIKDSFFSLMATFGLQSSLQIRTEQTYSFDALEQECSPIELQIYQQLATGDRLIAFSNRLMVNGAYASIIVKNMPVDDELRNGRLRDILATLIEGLDAKLLDLQRLNLLRQTSRELAMSSERMAKITKDHETHFTEAMNHAISEIHCSFDILELNEKQEEFFTALAERILLSVEDSFVQIGKETYVLECLRMSLSAVLHRT